jgi:pimeloyl-ACP methyl ester carboxylesterase
MTLPNQPVKPTVLLIQGSFQHSLVYTPLVECLVAKGYPAVYPALPSCTNISNPGFPSTNLVDDALAMRLELIRLIEYESKTVVVVMHSYGGLVGSEAISEDLTMESRKQRGLNGGVVHLFFFAAFLLEPGQSISSVFGESPNNDIQVLF